MQAIQDCRINSSVSIPGLSLNFYKYGLRLWEQGEELLLAVKHFRWLWAILWTFLLPSSWTELQNVLSTSLSVVSPPQFILQVRGGPFSLYKTCFCLLPTFSWESLIPFCSFCEIFLIWYFFPLCASGYRGPEPDPGLILNQGPGPGSQMLYLLHFLLKIPGPSHPDRTSIRYTVGCMLHLPLLRLKL